MESVYALQFVLLFPSFLALFWGVAVLFKTYAFIATSHLIIRDFRCVSRDFVILVNCKYFEKDLNNGTEVNTVVFYFSWFWDLPGKV